MAISELPPYLSKTMQTHTQEKINAGEAPVRKEVRLKGSATGSRIV
ncbi:MAG: hypothetical protein LBQ12_02485 [Deltaproteobacteria bacterium]|jgi:hypothetical protein|nr:hypothetical protein [Deltaproteobacteria bacterium]